MAGRRVAVALAGAAVTDVFDAASFEVDRVEADLVDAVLEEDFVVRRFLVLNGFATGARLIVPSAFVEVVGAGCFFFVATVSTA